MTDARVAIIGGGIMGVSLLYHLTRSGWEDVVLVEKHDLTHGSTWHAAGLCTHFAHHPTIQELRAHSVRLYRDILPEQTGLPTGFHPTGALRLARNQDRMDEFAHVAGLSAYAGHGLRLVAPEEIGDLHPLARIDGLLGGIHEPFDGHVDPSLATRALAEAARKQGGEIRCWTPVTEIRREAGRWILETGSGAIRARQVVNAAGTWGHGVGLMMGMDVPIVPILHQYLVTDTIEALVERRKSEAGELPIIRDPDESWYVRQERDGLIIGPYEADGRPWSVDGVPEDFGAELLPPDLDRVAPIVEAAMARIPALETAGIRTIVNGPITFSPDANPLIGPAGRMPGAWLLTGSSMGVMEGGGAGWFLAEWMRRGTPPMDALAVDPRRFGAWADRSFQVDKAIECFGEQFGIHFPREERPAGRGKRLSPIHDDLVARGAIMGAVNGWERPNWFDVNGTGDCPPSFRRAGWFDAVAGEVEAVTSRVGYADLSALSKFEISGPGTREALDNLGARRSTPDAGRVGLMHVLSDERGVQSEFAVSMITDDRAWLTSAAAAEQIDEAILVEGCRGRDVALKNVTDSFGVLAIAGPRSPELMRQLANTGQEFSTEAFPWMTCRHVLLAGISVLAIRLSYAGETGWELHVASRHMRELFHAVETKGIPLGLRPFGAYAIDSMRLEKGYPGWGTELTTERTPGEAGLSRLARAGGDEVTGGRAAARNRQDGTGRQRMDLALLRVECGGDDVDPFFGHLVLLGERPAGMVTSGSFGFRVGFSLAFAYLEERANPGDLEVDILGARYPARILEKPPFDPENVRPRNGNENLSKGDECHTRQGLAVKVDGNRPLIETET